MEKIQPNRGMLAKRRARNLRKKQFQRKISFIESFLSGHKKLFIGLIILMIAFGGGFFFLKNTLDHTSKQTILTKSLAVVEEVVQFLPVDNDTKDMIHVTNELSKSFFREDDVTRTYMVFLQNNYELRPGGGFLGQYAIVKVKNGEIISTFVEDANLLDQRITAKVTPPYPFERMMQIKKWKFRDSNFSPDFPTNVEKGKYFYRLSGRNSDFDGVIAINAEVLNAVLEITGPIKVPGYASTYTSEDAALQLEEDVEKAYLGEDVPAELKQNRKNVMKRLAAIIIEKAFTVDNVPALIDLAKEQLEKKNVMMYFEDTEMQALVESVHWDGTVNQHWDGDYLMAVDSNMGALKSDYFMERTMKYEVDLTLEKPIAKLTYTYIHNATYGDWRTSDYHSYLRLYVPQGSNLVERLMVSYPNIQEEFGKTYFGFIAHTLINDQTEAVIRYELPEKFLDWENYTLLIQKQSGVKDIPIEIHIKTPEGDYNVNETLAKDLQLELKTIQKTVHQ